MGDRSNHASPAIARSGVVSARTTHEEAERSPVRAADDPVGVPDRAVIREEQVSEYVAAQAPRRAVPVLIKALKDMDYWVRAASAWALDRIDPAGKDDR